MSQFHHPLQGKRLAWVVAPIAWCRRELPPRELPPRESSLQQSSLLLRDTDVRPQENQQVANFVNYIARIVTPTRVVIYNDNPTQSKNIMSFKWNRIGGGKNCKLVWIYFLDRVFWLPWLELFMLTKKTNKNITKIYR